MDGCDLCECVSVEGMQRRRRRWRFLRSSMTEERNHSSEGCEIVVVLFQCENDVRNFIDCDHL